MKLIRVLPACLLVLASCFPALEAFAKPKVKRKPGVVMKRAGYYCPIEKTDKVTVKTTVELAVAAASKKGYISQEDYFKQFCGTQSSAPHVMVPAEVQSFKFTLKHEGDQAAISPLRILKGTYKFTLSCDIAQTGDNDTFMGVVYGNDIDVVGTKSIQSEIKTFDAQQDIVFRIKDGLFTGFCPSGNFVIERLS